MLKGVSLLIRAGSKTLFMGESGVGKTTLLKLLADFYRPISGTITWDGCPYDEIRTQSLYQKIGYLFQDAYLFGDTIKNNILTGRPDASDEEVKHTAKLAGFDTVAERLPDGYDSVVGERGAFLSAGERQRLTLARLILKDPEVIILDESTANLDIETEAEVMENIFKKIFQDKTIISVSHRGNTIRYYDRVYMVTGEGIREYRQEEYEKRGGEGE